MSVRELVSYRGDTKTMTLSEDKGHGKKGISSQYIYFFHGNVDTVRIGQEIKYMGLFFKKICQLRSAFDHLMMAGAKLLYLNIGYLRIPSHINTD